MSTPTSTLSADALLAGAAATFTIDVPAGLVQPPPAREASADGARVAGQVVLRPLLVRDVDRITRAAKEQKVLTGVLMVKEALVAPKLGVDEVCSMPAGLLQFLLERVNALSGLALGDDDLEKAVRAPIAKACFVLAREFGWTPAQCSELTVGQILLYLEMLARQESPVREAV